jgi:hypothetical protein
VAVRCPALFAVTEALAGLWAARFAGRWAWRDDAGFFEGMAEYEEGKRRDPDQERVDSDA